MRLATVFLLSFLLVPAALAQDCAPDSEIAQTEKNAFANLIATQGLGQSFQPTCSGVLQGLSVDVESVSDGPIVGTLLVLDGNGSGDTLATAPYSLPDAGFQRIDVPSRVRLTAGQSYTFFLDAPTSGTGNINGFNGNPYADGVLYAGPDAATLSAFASDMTFRVDLGAPALQSIADMVEAYVWANQPGAASYTPDVAYAYNVEGATNTIERTDVGRYTVTLGDIPIFRDGNTGNVQVSAYGSNATCASGGWDSTPVQIRVLCRNPADEFVDSRYTVLYTRADATDFDAAYAFVSDPSETDYAPLAQEAYNSAGGPVRAFRYDNDGAVNQVIFSGFAERGAFDNSGHVQATAFGTTATGGAARCGLASFGTFDSGALSTDLRCRDLAGEPLVARHSVLFLKGGPVADGSAVAYAHPADRTNPSYAPDPARAYTSNGGAVTATRSGVGIYTAVFEGLGSTTTAGGTVQVTSFNNDRGYCTVGGWDSDASGDALVDITCFDDAGVAADKEYSVLYIWPDNEVTAVAADLGPSDATLGISIAGANPVVRRSELAVTLAEAGVARVSVIDLLGREVAVLADRQLVAGTTRVELDASSLQPGIYVARVLADGQARTVRFTVVR